jgi:hypothetical protein
MDPNALKQQAGIVQQQINPYAQTQFVDPASLAATQAAVQKALANDLYSQDNIEQMKGAARDTGVSMGSQFGDQLKEQAAQRGLMGGGMDAAIQQGQQKTMEEVLRGNREVDLTVPGLNRDALMNAISAGQGMTQLEQFLQQAQADENYRGFGAGLDLGRFNIDQQMADRDVGFRNASQALESWKAFNGLSSENFNQDAARQLQDKLGMAGISADVLASLMQNNQATNRLGYDYSALSAAQQQALLNSLMPKG